MLSHINDAELLALKEQESLVLKGIPSHSQAVEQAIKLISESAVHVRGQAARDGNILQTIKGRDLRSDRKKLRYH